MSNIAKLVQGTAEWHEHRKLYRNASETPAVMGVSPWMSPFQLWELKTDRAQPAEATAPMKRGTELEPKARAAYEVETGAVMQPLVMTAGDYSASLDGITLEGDLIVEIKCPYKGQASDLWQSVETGQIPEMYRVQIQHQLFVSGATLAHLWIFDGTSGLLLNVDRDEVCQQRIRNAWDAFQSYVDTDTPPPYTEQDTKVRTDAAWKMAAEAYRGWKDVADDAMTKADAAKAKLIELATHSREAGCGVSVTRFWKQGNVDYKKVVELQGVDLEQYRGKAREEIRVTLSA